MIISSRVNLFWGKHSGFLAAVSLDSSGSPWMTTKVLLLNTKLTGIVRQTVPDYRFEISRWARRFCFLVGTILFGRDYSAIYIFSREFQIYNKPILYFAFYCLGTDIASGRLQLGWNYTIWHSLERNVVGEICFRIINLYSTLLTSSQVESDSPKK